MTDKNIDSEEEKELQEEQIESEINSNSKTETENEEVSEPLNEHSELEKIEEKFLRSQAELQNLRRISLKQLAKARLYGSENLVKDLIPSIDNLFRTLDNKDIEKKQFHQRY